VYRWVSCGERRRAAIAGIYNDQKGRVRDNIVYGNEDYAHWTAAQLTEVLEKSNLSSLLTRFSEGLETKVTRGGSSISLGQK
jgi:ATP-binding cassette subfamily B protein